MQAGIYSNMADLLGFRFHVKRKKLAHQQTLISAKGGYHQAIRKGRGMTFTEVREYQSGDEIRHIDWKVSARTQKTHTKVFTEELEKPIICLTEQTPNLFFGSHVRFKTAQAMNLTAIIGWIALNNGDKFGGQVFNHQQSSWNPAKQNHKGLLQLLHNGVKLQTAIKSPLDTNPQTWTQQLESVKKQISSGNRIFLIGDFLNQPNSFFQQLAQFKKRNQIILLHIFDPLDKALPKAGSLSFSNGIKRFLFDTSQASQQQKYQQAYQQSWQALKIECGKFHIPLIEINSSLNPVSELISQKVIQ
jgi:uncharacterized protein (DUF58 family)